MDDRNPYASDKEGTRYRDLLIAYQTETKKEPQFAGWESTDGKNYRPVCVAADRAECTDKLSHLSGAWLRVVLPLGERPRPVSLPA